MSDWSVFAPPQAELALELLKPEGSGYPAAPFLIAARCRELGAAGVLELTRVLAREAVEAAGGACMHLVASAAAEAVQKAAALERAQVH